MKLNRSMLHGAVALLISACAATPREQLPTRPPTSAELAMGYQDAVDLGTQHVTQQGYTDAELYAVHQVQPNIWRVRFGLAPKGSGRLLDLYFDGTRRQLLRAQELTDAEGRPLKSEDGGLVPLR